MSSNDPTDNPYRAPLADAAAETPAGEMPRRVQFRQQIQALGAFWIFIGAATMGLSAIVFAKEHRPILEMPLQPGLAAMLLAAIGGAWIVLGVLTCLKRMAAVKIALGLSYLALIINALALQFCAAVVIVIVILQAHRVIRWSSMLRHASHAR